MDPDKLIASADVEILELHAQKWRQTLRLLQSPAGAALRECYASCSKSLIPFLTPTVATPPVSEKTAHPLTTDELLDQVDRPAPPPAPVPAAMNRSKSQLDNTRADQGDERHRRYSGRLNLESGQSLEEEDYVSEVLTKVVRKRGCRLEIQ